MRYNPCGRAVEMGRRPYTTQCRFWRDNTEQIGYIKWVIADPAAGTLPYPSKINSLDYSSHPWLASGVGEVYNVPRPYNGANENPLLFGPHVCGTPRDFAEGGLYQPDLPPVQYDTSGACLCCRDVAIGVGGAVAGGQAEAVWVPPVAPGPTCPVAGVMPLNSAGWTGNVAPGHDYWFISDVPQVNGVTYFLEISGAPPGFDPSFTVYTGPSCFALSAVQNRSGNGVIHFTGGAFAYFWYIDGETLASLTGVTIRWGTTPPGP